MKVIKALKSIGEIFWIEHMMFPLRMLLVYEAIRYLYVGSKLNLKDEAETLGTYFFIFVLVYVLTSVLDLKRANSTPFYLSEFIEGQISDDYILRDVFTFDDKRGVYARSMHVEGIQVISSFHLHEDPAYIKGRASAFSLILSSMQIPSHQKKIDKLDRIVDEANFMLDIH